MAQHIHFYRGKAITVSYDAKRCIHAAECISHLQEVFDTRRRRWVEPDNAAPGDVAQVVMLCPTGALHYASDNLTPEPLPAQNTITLVQNGPLYVRGNITIKDADGQVILRDTRAALCRCGKSANKPFCDNAHNAAGFSAPGKLREHRSQPQLTDAAADELIITIESGGSYRVQGEMSIYGMGDQLLMQTNQVTLCRCGNSDDKPFCDGTHNFIEWQ